MAFTSLSFAGFATFPRWRQERDARTGSDIDTKPFPSKSVSNAITFFLALASLLLLVSALWQHVATASIVSTVSSMSQRKLVGHVGAVAAVLVWLSLTFVIIAFIATAIMIFSIHLLDRLTDE
jgi:hypothetical protein